jgi:hypothetical protein
MIKTLKCQKDQIMFPMVEINIDLHPLDLHRNIENRTSNTDWYKKYKGKKWIRNRFFPQLNMIQRKLIVNSATMERLIPIISRLKDIS